MDTEDAGPAPEARPPLLEDLVSLCRNLNREGARYVVIGDTSPDNQDRVRRALMALPDQAIRDMAADDLEKYAVVRVADEIVVDLMRSACGIAYAEARSLVVPVEIEGVLIPFASPRLLWLTKDTLRDQDKVDRAFLAQLLAARGESID
jgi:hypothetical protein